MCLGERAGTAKQNEGPADSVMCSSFIQNMSCRPRTTVRSKGLTCSKVPARLRGERILVDVEWMIPACLKYYTGENLDMCVPIFNALLTLGDRRSLKAYRHFIDCQPAHEQSLTIWMMSVPEEISKLPGVGFIKRPGTSGGSNRILAISSLHAALYIMARSNRSVYIRKKSPLLSLIAVERKIQVIFVNRRR